MAAAASEFDNVEFGPPCHNTCQLTGTDASCFDTEMLLQSTKNRIIQGIGTAAPKHNEPAVRVCTRSSNKHGRGGPPTPRF
jgi:hypothetical protein